MKFSRGIIKLYFKNSLVDVTFKVLELFYHWGMKFCPNKER